MIGREVTTTSTRGDVPRYRVQIRNRYSPGGDAVLQETEQLIEFIYGMAYEVFAFRFADKSAAFCVLGPISPMYEDAGIARDIFNVRHESAEPRRLPDGQIIGSCGRRLLRLERIAIVLAVYEEFSRRGDGVGFAALDEELHCFGGCKTSTALATTATF